MRPPVEVRGVLRGEEHEELELDVRLQQEPTAVLLEQRYGLRPLWPSSDMQSLLTRGLLACMGHNEACGSAFLLLQHMAQRGVGQVPPASDEGPES